MEDSFLHPSIVSITQVAPHEALESVAGPSGTSEAPSSSSGAGKNGLRKAKRGRGVNTTAGSSQPSSQQTLLESDAGREIMETDDLVAYWPCTHCTYLNTDSSPVCEMCEQPRVG